MRGKTFIPQDYDVFAGLYVDKRSISVPLPIAKDSFIRSMRIPYNVKHLLRAELRAQALFGSKGCLCL